MPELAEVEYFRRRWQPGVGRKVAKVFLNPKARIGRGVDAKAMSKALTGAKLIESFAAAKQMAFRFSGNVWLGVHLGMTGRLEAGDNIAVLSRNEKGAHLLPVGALGAMSN